MDDDRPSTPAPDGNELDERPGQLRRMRMLGSQAVYRIVGCDGDLIIAEAVDVPGMRPGHRVRLTAAAVARMEIVPPTS